MRPRNIAGDLLLAPPVLLALAALIVNDHVLKGIGPPPLTGILSGVAGLVLMPCVLVAAAELVGSLRDRSWRPTLRPMLIAAAGVGGVYTAVELVPGASELYRWTWGALQWPGAVAAALVASQPFPAIVPVQAVADPLDLLALPVLAVPMLVQWQRVRRCQEVAAPNRTALRAVRSAANVTRGRRWTARSNGPMSGSTTRSSATRPHG